MFQAIVTYPKIKDTSSIQAIREKYDPQFQLIKPHITVVFPFPAIDKDVLCKHINRILSFHSAFNITLEGLKCSFDNYLFLLINQGNDTIVRLHDELYTKVLAEHLRKDIEYDPHVGLGSFKTKSGCKDAEKKVEKLNLRLNGIVETLDLLEIEEDHLKLKTIRRFELKTGS